MSDTKTYVGVLVGSGHSPEHAVFIRPFDRGAMYRLDPRGPISWGAKHGPASATLAKVLLADVLGEEPHPSAYIDLRKSILDGLPETGFELSAQYLQGWVAGWACAKHVGTLPEGAHRPEGFRTMAEYRTWTEQ